MGLATSAVIAAGALILRNAIEPSLVQAFITTAVFSLLGDLAGFIAVGRRSRGNLDVGFTQ